MHTRNFTFPFLFAMLLLVVSCKKDKNDPKPSEPVLTINFTDKFIPDQIPAIVFLSGKDGKTFLDTTCISNGSYELFSPDGAATPENFMVTIVSSELYWHSLIVHINTYTGIDKGAEWTLQGTKPDTVSSSSITLENMPEISGPILYSGQGFSNLTFNPTNRSIWNYQLPDDLYVKIQTDTGQYYSYNAELMTGGSYTIDMSAAEKTESQTVTLPMQVENYETKVFGYKNDDFDSPIPIVVEYLISDGMMTDNILLHYPPAIFSGFHTSMMIQETYLSELSWFYQNEGEIPDQFVKIDADILTSEFTDDKLTIQSGGSFDMVAAHWQFIDHSLMFYEWQMHASDTTTVMILPEIPSAFLRMFPTISHDSLQYQYTELTEFQQLESYTSLINKIFDPTHPTQMNRYEASSIRKSVIQAGKK